MSSLSRAHICCVVVQKNVNKTTHNPKKLLSPSPVHKHDRYLGVKGFFEAGECIWSALMHCVHYMLVTLQFNSDAKR